MCAFAFHVLSEMVSNNVETVVIPLVFTNTLLHYNMYALTRSVSRMGFVARSLQCSSRLYHDLVIDHYEHPRNVGRVVEFFGERVGSFDANDDDIGTGIAGAPACGDVMKLQVLGFCFQ